MKSNTLWAFLIIIGSVMFFSSERYQKFFYEHLYPRKPYPHRTKVTRVQEKTVGATATDTAKTAETLVKDAVLDTAVTNSEGDSASAPVIETIDTTWIETKTMIVGISNRGARIISIKMKEFAKDHSQKGVENFPENQLVDLVPDSSEGGAGITIGTETFDDRYFVSPVDKKIVLDRNADSAVDFICKTPDGKEVVKEFVFKNDGYKIGLKIKSDRLLSNRVNVSWLAGINESEEKFSFYKREARKSHYSDGKSVNHYRTDKTTKGAMETSGFYRWVGVSSTYFFLCLVADSLYDSDISIDAVAGSNEKSARQKKGAIKKVNYSFSYEYNPNASVANVWFYAGPSDLKVLEKAGPKFKEIMFPVLGITRFFFWSDRWFPPLARVVLSLLLWIGSLVKDYGLAIVILTVLSKVVTFPFAQMSAQKMSVMKEIQPKVNAIREKYKANPQKMNEAIMELYKKEGVNPLNPGCLPMVLQMPIFIALYNVLQRAIELRGSSTFLLPWIHDLSQAEVIFSFDKILPGGIPMYGSSFAILPVINSLLTFLQMKMTSGNDPNQKMMLYFMPIFMLVLFNNFASGMVLYWTLQNLLGIGIQFYNNRQNAKKELTAAKPGVVAVAARRKGKNRK